MQMKCKNIKDILNKCKKKETKFFTQFTVEEKVKIPSQKPDLEDITSVIVDPQIVSMRVINTPIGTSHEGQKLSGTKVSFEIKFRQKIIYISKTTVQSVHVVENEFFYSTYIVVPSLIHGSKIEDLITNKYLIPHIIIEEVRAEKIDDRTIFKNLILYIELKLCDTYQICYSESHNCKNNILYVAHETGEKKIEIAELEGYKVLNIKWSPSGKKIAYICIDNNNHTTLCISNIKGGNVMKITDPYILNPITSFSWGADGKDVLFSAYLDGKKDIFSIDINTYEWKQLTYSKLGCKNFKPRISPKGNKIAFLKTVHGDTDLYTMNTSGLDTKKITNLGDIKDFDWQNDELGIAFVTYSSHKKKEAKNNYCLGEEKKCNEIFFTDILSCNSRSLEISENNLHIKKIKFSPDNRYISFIGWELNIENIYLFDLIKQEIINITNNEFEARIPDFDWHIDSTKIFFCCNLSAYYNVYEFSLISTEVTQVSNNGSDNLNISCRTKII